MSTPYTKSPWWIEPSYEDNRISFIRAEDEDGLEFNLAMLVSPNLHDRQIMSLAPDMADAIDETIPFLSGILDNLSDHGLVIDPEWIKHLNWLEELRDRFAPRQDHE